MAMDQSAIAPPDPTPAEGTPSEQPNSPAPEATEAANALTGRQPAFDNRAFTQSTQLAAAVRRELGLERNASEQEVVEALRLLRETQQPTTLLTDDDLEAQADPVFVERYREMQDELWSAQARIHGDALANESRSLQEAARKMSPAQFIAATAEFVMKVTTAPDEGTGGVAPATAPEVPSLGSGEPSLAPQRIAQPGAGDLAGTGRVADFIGRRLFGREQ